MLPQHLSVVVDIATNGTDIAPLLSMNLNMVIVLFVHPFIKSLSTVFTLKHHVLLLGVHNLPQSCVAAEAGSTLVTLERFLISVHCHVVAQTTAVGKLRRTTFEVWLVKSLVHVQTSTGRVILTTNDTEMLSVLFVHCLFVIV